MMYWVIDSTHSKKSDLQKKEITIPKCIFSRFLNVEELIGVCETFISSSTHVTRLPLLPAASSS